MSRLGDAVVYAQDNPGLTLNDLVTELGYQDPAERGSLKAQLRRALAPGGTHRELAERGIIKPGDEDKTAAWAKGLEIGQTRHPIVIRSKAFGEVRTLDTSTLPTRVSEPLNRLMDLNLTGRKGQVVSGYVLVSTGHMELLQARLEGMERERVAHLDQIGSLKEEAAFLRSLIKGGGGGTVGPAEAAE